MKITWWRFQIVSHYKWFPQIGLELDLYMQIFIIHLILVEVIIYYGK